VSVHKGDEEMCDCASHVQTRLLLGTRLSPRLCIRACFSLSSSSLCARLGTRLNFLSKWGAKRRTTVLLGLRDDLADGFCDGVVAIAVDVEGWLGTTTWIAPVEGRVGGFVSSDLCGGLVGKALGIVGAFEYRRWYIKKSMGGDGYGMGMFG
jgi:hypothetical protein